MGLLREAVCTEREMDVRGGRDMTQIARTVTKAYRPKSGDPTYQDIVNLLAAIVLRSGGTVSLAVEEMRHKSGLFLGVSGNMEHGYLIQVIEVPVVENGDAGSVGAG